VAGKRSERSTGRLVTDWSQRSFLGKIGALFGYALCGAVAAGTMAFFPGVALFMCSQK